jgi:hypothetical protein
MADSRRSVLVAAAGLVLALLTSAGRARAEVSVSLQYGSEAELEHARRVASELTSEGYAVEIGGAPELSPCDPNGPRLVTISRGTKAWIRLAVDPADADRVVAFICYLGVQPLLQQAVPSAPRAESDRLALAAAEALNGLRARLPPLQGQSELIPRSGETPAVTVAQRPRSEPPPPKPAANSLVLATSLVRNFPDFPLTPGIAGRGTLGIIPSLGLVIDAFVPTTGAELASQVVTAKLRSSWLRIGPCLGWVLGDFEISAAALAGPAFTWATAVAVPPREGTADVATSAILTLGAFLQYPSTTPIFGSASASASVLLPAPRVNLGDGAPAPRGYWPVDASIGLGVRWGG